MSLYLPLIDYAILNIIGELYISMAVTVRRYTESDRDSFMELYQEFFSQISDELFEWRFEQAPFTNDPQIVVAEDGDNVVGALGGFLVPFYTQGQSIMGCMPTDFMIHKDFRGANLFIKLVQELRATYENVSVEFGTGAPNTHTAWEQFGGWARLLETTSFPNILSELSDVIYNRVYTLRDHMNNMEAGNECISKEQGYMNDVFGIEKDTEFELSISRNSRFWEWRIDDPRINSFTYWAGNENEPLASVLFAVPNSDQPQVGTIALQEQSNTDRGFSALLSIFSQIFKDFKDITYIKSLNTTDKIAKSIGANQTLLLNNIKTNPIIISLPYVQQFVSDMSNIPESDIDKRKVGYKWFDNNMTNLDPSVWEFSDLIYDYIPSV